MRTFKQFFILKLLTLPFFATAVGEFHPLCKELHEGEDKSFEQIKNCMEKNFPSRNDLTEACLESYENYVNFFQKSHNCEERARFIKTKKK